MNDANKSDTHYSEIEVHDLLGCLGDADIVRLLQVFQTLGCAARTGLSNQDVLGHVVGQALALERPWPRNVNAAAYLIQSGKSLISNEETKRAKLLTTSTFDEVALGEDVSRAVADLSHAAPEAHIELSQSSDIVMGWIAQIQQLFEEDDDASCFIKQKLDAQKKAKILILCVLTDQVYRNVEKRIKDKVKKRFPNGLPWWEILS